MMAGRLGLSNEVKEMKLGKSFGKVGNPSFHTFRYDFMPASVDVSKRATVDIGDGHQVTVTVPHIEGSGTSNTVFKGSKKPYQKECVLVIDHSTGEITLEKLSYNVQLKKTRAEGSSKIRSSTPVDAAFSTKKSPPCHKLSPHPHKPQSSSHGRLSPTVPKHFPIPKSPVSSQPSPNGASNPPSMPSLNMSTLSSIPEPPVVHKSNDVAMNDPDVGVLSSSSSSDSSSSGDSSDNEEAPKPAASITNAVVESKKDSTGSSSQQTTANSLRSMPKFSQLSEDLKLSESDDSDF